MLGSRVTCRQRRLRFQERFRGAYHTCLSSRVPIEVIATKGAGSTGEAPHPVARTIELTVRTKPCPFSKHLIELLILVSRGWRHASYPRLQRISPLPRPNKHQ